MSDLVDFKVPPAPVSDSEGLLEYLNGPYMVRRDRIRELMGLAREISDKSAVIKLGVESLLFLSELNPWVALAQKILNEQWGSQLSIAHGSRDKTEKAPSVEYLKAQASIYTAPIKRALEEMKSTQDLLSKTISWCQTQQKTVSAEEYAESFSHSNDVPEEFFNTPAIDLEQEK